MRGFTLLNPWAGLVAERWKWIETRSWGTKYRGWVAVHAGGSKEPTLSEEMRKLRMAVLGPRVLVAGAIVAVQELVDVWRVRADLGPDPNGIFHLFSVETIEDDPKVKIERVLKRELVTGDLSVGRVGWRFGERGWKLPRPIEVRGALGLWAVMPEIAREIDAQLMRGSMFQGLAAAELAKIDAGRPAFAGPRRG